MNDLHLASPREKKPEIPETVLLACPLHCSSISVQGVLVRGLCFRQIQVFKSHKRSQLLDCVTNPV